MSRSVERFVMGRIRVAAIAALLFCLLPAVARADRSHERGLPRERRRSSLSLFATAHDVDAIRAVAIAGTGATGASPLVIPSGDGDGDGAGDLVVVADGVVRLLSGVNGAVRWSSNAPGAVAAWATNDASGVGLLVVAVSPPRWSDASHTEVDLDETVSRLAGRTGGVVWRHSETTRATVVGPSPRPGAAEVTRVVDAVVQVAGLDLDGGAAAVLLDRYDTAGVDAAGAGGPVQATERPVVLDAATGATRVSLAAAGALNDWPLTFTVGDTDGDGVTDLATTDLSTSSGARSGFSQHGLAAVSGRDGHVLWTSGPVALPGSGESRDVFDGDQLRALRGRRPGRADVLLATDDTEPSVLTLIDGGSGDVVWQRQTTSDAADVGDFLVGDANRDGADDVVELVYGDCTCGTLVAVDGRGGRTIWEAPLRPDESLDWTALSGDFDGDGATDLLVVGGAAGQPGATETAVSSATGTALWTVTTDQATALAPAGDVDGDRRTDLTAVSYSSTGVASTYVLSGRSGRPIWAASDPYHGLSGTPFVASLGPRRLVRPLDPARTATSPAVADVYSTAGTWVWTN